MSVQSKQTAIRLSSVDEQLLTALAAKKGINKTSVIKIALRELADREGIHVSEGDTSATQRETKLQEAVHA